MIVKLHELLLNKKILEVLIKLVMIQLMKYQNFYLKQQKIIHLLQKKTQILLTVAGGIVCWLPGMAYQTVNQRARYLLQLYRWQPEVSFLKAPGPACVFRVYTD